ncbi:uncharacterized protein LOC117122730 [Anneissia japonica]|uniref:uncharacterized protein LOC117122730 n=1 Tax=Anneissia japonica TaxID=1529436 RepID=UPI0014258A54|nr:uncharacterized protein LOC117122730 [Anneissia japonica]
MVGHTHEDIDQMFSCVSKYLKKHRTVTLDHLQHAIETSYQKLTITTSVITHIFDIKDWIQPYLQDIRYHSKPHQFKFTVDDTGKCIMRTKNWSTDDKWAECTKELDTSPYLLKGIPATGSPELCSPNFDNVDLPKLQKSIVSVKNYLRTEEMEWWKTFLNGIDETFNGM